MALTLQLDGAVAGGKVEVRRTPKERWWPKDRGCLHWEAQDFTGRSSDFLGHPGGLPGDGVLRAGSRGKVRLNSGLMVRGAGQGSLRKIFHTKDAS